MMSLVLTYHWSFSDNHLYNGHFFQVPRVAVVHRFDCISFIYILINHAFIKISINHAFINISINYAFINVCIISCSCIIHPSLLKCELTTFSIDRKCYAWILANLSNSSYSSYSSSTS